MATELLLPFLVASLTFALVPGPSIVYLLARTLSEGQRAGLEAMAGVHLGAYVHIVAATAGLTLLFEAVPWLFSAVKTAGACYVIFIGIQLFRRPKRLDALPARTRGQSFGQSMMTEILNPTTALFFFAFLPQFASPDALLSLPAQMLILGAAANLLFSIADLPYVFAAASLRVRLMKGRLAERVQQAGGALLVALGLHLAVNRTA